MWVKQLQRKRRDSMQDQFNSKWLSCLTSRSAWRKHGSISAVTVDDRPTHLKEHKWAFRGHKQTDRAKELKLFKGREEDWSLQLCLQLFWLNAGISTDGITANAVLAFRVELQRISWVDLTENHSYISERTLLYRLFDSQWGHNLLNENHACWGRLETSDLEAIY